MRPAIRRAPGACATSNPRGISHYPANLGERKCQIQNSSRDGTRCVKTGLAARRRGREFLIVVLPLERRAHGAIEPDLPRRNLPQRQHRRLVLRLDQRPCPCHELPGALGREQDQREAVVHERKAVFDGDTSHASAPEESETGWIPDPLQLRNGFAAYLLACGGAGGASK